MRYVASAYKLHQEEVAYRIYVTDSLYYSAEGKQLVKRYADILHPQPIDNRSGDEIALDVIQRLDLKFNE